MINELKKNYILNVDGCDSFGQMSPISYFTHIQNISVEHANMLGLHPYILLKNNEFWVLTHILLQINNPIYFTEEFTITTWPQKSNESLRNYRQYRFEKNGEPFALAKSQWAIIKNKQVISIEESSLDKNLIYPQKDEFDQSLSIFEDDFNENDLLATYKVVSGDIDINHHMNNVAYLRILLNCFTVEQLHSHKIKSIEIHYGKSCFENETLKIYAKEKPNCLSFAIKKADNHNAVIGEIKY